jgi:hypothetical protein
MQRRLTFSNSGTEDVLIDSKSTGCVFVDPHGCLQSIMISSRNSLAPMIGDLSLDREVEIMYIYKSIDGAEITPKQLENPRTLGVSMMVIQTLDRLTMPSTL